MNVKLLDLNGKPFFVEVPEEEMSQEVLDCIEQENRKTDTMLRQYKRKVDGYSEWDSISFNAMHIPESLRSLVESPENLYIRREMISDIIGVLETCTPVQYRRFLLHSIWKYSYEEIAQQSQCSKASVQKIIDDVRRKIMSNVN